MYMCVFVYMQVCLIGAESDVNVGNLQILLHFLDLYTNCYKAGFLPATCLLISLLFKFIYKMVSCFVAFWISAPLIRL